MRRFFTERTNLTIGSSVKLNEDEAGHIKDTLRMSVGEMIVLFNGEREYIAKLGAVNKQGVLATILDTVESGHISVNKPNINLFIGMIKPAKFELILQKATEIGIKSFTPIITEYSQIKPEAYHKKYSRWERIIIEACKQSEAVEIPSLNKVVELDELLQNKSTEKTIVLGIERNGQIKQQFNLSDLTSTPDLEDINLLVGPEGGFSPGEYEKINTNNLAIWQLFAGERILKAETAAIVAAGILQNELFAKA